MKLKTLKTTEIKPYFRNPRRNDLAIESVMQSIQRYGYCQPIAVDSSNVIVAGHTRYAALLRLGFKEIPVVILDNLTPEKAKEYRIIDNRSAEMAEWDNDKMIQELNEINAAELLTVFSDLSLDRWIQHQEQEFATEKTMQTKASDMATQYKQSKEYTDITCPNCGHEFATDQ